MTHAEAAEILAAYALDAVDGAEAAAVEDHLRDCPRCRAALAQHREVAAHLAYGGADAPEGVWGKIAAELGPSPEPRLPRLYARPRWLAPALAVAAALVVVALGSLAVQLHDQQSKVRSLQASAHQTRAQQLMTTAGLDPASTRLTLASADHRIQLAVVVTRDGSAYLASNGTLPALPASETYQLWSVAGSAPISLAVIGNHPQVVAFADPFTPPLAMALTVEHAGGAVAPSGVPVASGTTGVRS